MEDVSRHPGAHDQQSTAREQWLQQQWHQAEVACAAAVEYAHQIDPSAVVKGDLDLVIVKEAKIEKTRNTTWRRKERESTPVGRGRLRRSD